MKNIKFLFLSLSLLLIACESTPQKERKCSYSYSTVTVVSKDSEVYTDMEYKYTLGKGFRNTPIAKTRHILLYSDNTIEEVSIQEYMKATVGSTKQIQHTNCYYK